MFVIDCTQVGKFNHLADRDGNSWSSSPLSRHHLRQRMSEPIVCGGNMLLIESQNANKDG